MIDTREPDSKCPNCGLPNMSSDPYHRYTHACDYAAGLRAERDVADRLNGEYLRRIELHRGTIERARERAESREERYREIIDQKQQERNEWRKRAERAEAKVKELLLKVHQLEVHYALFAGQAFPYTGLEPGDDHG